ncbi:hypothetical protein D3C85_753630 [compost metagenome]
MNLSIYDLSYEYMKRNWPTGFTATNEDKVSIKKGLEAVLQDRFTAEEMMDIIDNSPVNKMAINPKDVFQSVVAAFPDKPRQDLNLIKPNKFYWHPQLRILPPAPQRVLDYDTGIITKVEQPYFMEMKASYTARDLAEYYVRQTTKIGAFITSMNQIVGSMNHLLNNHSIDTVLFMIDAATNYIREGDRRPLKSPLDIQDFLVEARGMLSEKMTAEIESGDDKIVPKQRIPLGGGRSETAERPVPA